MIFGMTEPMKASALRRWPLILSAVIVLAAVAVMVRLGFWQLDRLAQKQDMLERFAAAASAPEVPFEGWSRGRDATDDQILYRRVRFECRAVTGIAARAGQNASGQSGWRHLATCTAPQGSQVKVVLGWSQRPDAVGNWSGGPVRGIFNGDRLLVAEPPLAGLTANAKPDPGNIANNHLAYAVQWFLFALTALVIYALALRTRLRG
jgi:surfeit locus 1 family protein